VSDDSGINVQVDDDSEIDSHFSLAIVVVADVLLTIPLALVILINDIVTEEVAVVVALPTTDIIALDVVVELAVTVALD
jgi:hypothetical protein